MNKRRTVGVIALIIILDLALVSTLYISPQTPKKTATFIIAGWNYPNDYGQGISRINMHENSSGSWQQLNASPVLYSDDSEVEVPATNATAIRLQPRAYIFPNIHDLNDYDDATAIMRLNVTVWHEGEIIFSKQNLTLEGTEETEGNLWYIVYEVILNFLIEEFTVYHVYLTYEIYSGPSTETVFLDECVNPANFTYHSNEYLDPEDYGLDISVLGFPFSIEYWLAPKDIFHIEQVVYKLDFDEIDNSDGDLLIRVKYKVESASNEFKYRVYYNDTTKTDSNIGTSQSWAYLTLDPDNKPLDYLLFYNYATPLDVSSGNYSVWLDTVRIYDTSPSKDWSTITEVSLYLETQLSETGQWAFDGTLIFAGLIMIPVSTIYLAYGAKHDRSSDRLFYGLIILFLGCGLLIGGVMP